MIGKLTPFLWFDKNAEEAANYYVSVFPNSKITSILRHDANSAKANNMPEGSVLTVGFNLDGNDFAALNGGPHFKMTGAVSFVILCETQEEVDHYWEKLTEGGQEMDCGWAVDKFGMTWQITPTILPKYLADPDKEKSERVMKCMLTMKKLEIEPLEKAYRGE
jgi:predicted 3-demethylubiquinone-9 3-methyltransferase (glyoxalase superfamily)